MDEPPTKKQRNSSIGRTLDADNNWNVINPLNFDLPDELGSFDRSNDLGDTFANQNQCYAAENNEMKMDVDPSTVNIQSQQYTLFNTALPPQKQYINNSVHHELNLQNNSFSQNINQSTKFLCNSDSSEGSNFSRERTLTLNNSYHSANNMYSPEDSKSKDFFEQLSKDANVTQPVDSVAKNTNILAEGRKRFKGRKVHNTSCPSSGNLIPLTPPLTPVVTNSPVYNLKENQPAVVDTSKRISRAVKRNSSDRLLTSNLAISSNQNQQIQPAIRPNSNTSNQPTSFNNPPLPEIPYDQLKMFWHAFHCEGWETQGVWGASSDSRPYCISQGCAQVKQLMHHVTNCPDNDRCQVNQCLVLRQHMYHWRNCTYSQCEICTHLRRTMPIANTVRYAQQTRRTVSNEAVSHQLKSSIKPHNGDMLCGGVLGFTTADQPGLQDAEKIRQAAILSSAQQKFKDANSMRNKNNMAAPTQSMRNLGPLLNASVAHPQSENISTPATCSVNGGAPRDICNPSQGTDVDEILWTYNTLEIDPALDGIYIVNGRIIRKKMIRGENGYGNTGKVWHNDLLLSVRRQIIHRLAKSYGADSYEVNTKNEYRKQVMDVSINTEREAFESTESKEEYYMKLAGRVADFESHHRDKMTKRASTTQSSYVYNCRARSESPTIRRLLTSSGEERAVMASQFNNGFGYRQPSSNKDMFTQSQTNNSSQILDEAPVKDKFSPPVNQPNATCSGQQQQQQLVTDMKVLLDNSLTKQAVATAATNLQQLAGHSHSESAAIYDPATNVPPSASAVNFKTLMSPPNQLLNYQGKKRLSPLTMRAASSAQSLVNNTDRAQSALNDASIQSRGSFSADSYAYNAPSSVGEYKPGFVCSTPLAVDESEGYPMNGECRGDGTATQGPPNVSPVYPVKYDYRWNAATSQVVPNVSPVTRGCRGDMPTSQGPPNVSPVFPVKSDFRWNAATSQGLPNVSPVTSGHRGDVPTSQAVPNVLLVTSGYRGDVPTSQAVLNVSPAIRGHNRCDLATAQPLPSASPVTSGYRGDVPTSQALPNASPVTSGYICDVITAQPLPNSSPFTSEYRCDVVTSKEALPKVSPVIDESKTGGNYYEDISDNEEESSGDDAVKQRTTLCEKFNLRSDELAQDNGMREDELMQDDLMLYDRIQDELMRVDCIDDLKEEVTMSIDGEPKITNEEAGDAEHKTMKEEGDVNVEPNTMNEGEVNIEQKTKEEEVNAESNELHEILPNESDVTCPSLDPTATSDSLAMIHESSDLKSITVPLPMTRKEWSYEELVDAFEPIIQRMYSIEPEGIPFRNPVDPVALCIPDYTDKIKAPMDLSTIKSKLLARQYSDPWSVIADFALMFDNAWLYNKKTSKVYKFCSKVSEIFDVEADIAMKQLGYCCGGRYIFTPHVLCCDGKPLCIIPRDAAYHIYMERYLYCEKCFNDIQNEDLALVEDPTQPDLKLSKELFQKVKNDGVNHEPFVDCLVCHRRMHKICVLQMEQMYPDGFKCDACLQATSTKRMENKYPARTLPTTKLSTYLEARVNSFLKRKSVATTGGVTIRVLSSYDKATQVKPGMKARFSNNTEVPDAYPYRVKAVFAFEEIDGVDVCFFGMHVQEYGSDCPAPNTRRVYISYLDSVQFFQPAQCRTLVYYEIINGYLEYAKNLGYETAHIWACPPGDGDDYIFYCHPPEQKMPKARRLQDWYRRMLDIARCERIIYDYRDILEDATDNDLTSVSQMPYFEGDFWSNIIEDCIRELEQEEEEHEKNLSIGDLMETEMLVDASNGQKKGKAKKKAPKSRKTKGRSNKTVQNYCGTSLIQKLLSTMEKHKEGFFVVRLQPPNSKLRVIEDPDPLMDCDLMDGREALLTMSRDRHCEFSSLRRAKYSTLVLLFELHHPAKDEYVVTCDNCKDHVETRYHCTVCEDVDLCVQCYLTVDHPHPMMKTMSEMESDNIRSVSENTPITTTAENNIAMNTKITEPTSIQTYVTALQHACLCRDANCRRKMCRQMKRVMAHNPSCKNQSGCPVCKQLRALCLNHAKMCREKRCLVPYCATLREKLEQQRVEQQRKEELLMRRRMAQMNMTRNVSSAQEKQQESALNVSHLSQDTSSQSQSQENSFGGPAMSGKCVKISETSQSTVQAQEFNANKQPRKRTAWSMTVNGMLQGRFNYKQYAATDNQASHPLDNSKMSCQMEQLSGKKMKDHFPQSSEASILTGKIHRQPAMNVKNISNEKMEEEFCDRQGNDGIQNNESVTVVNNDRQSLITALHSSEGTEQKTSKEAMDTLKTNHLSLAPAIKSQKCFENDSGYSASSDDTTYNGRRGSLGSMGSFESARSSESRCSMGSIRSDTSTTDNRESLLWSNNIHDTRMNLAEDSVNNRPMSRSAITGEQQWMMHLQSSLSVAGASQNIGGGSSEIPVKDTQGGNGGQVMSRSASQKSLEIMKQFSVNAGGKRLTDAAQRNSVNTEVAPVLRLTDAQRYEAMIKRRMAQEQAMLAPSNQGPSQEQLSHMSREQYGLMNTTSQSSQNQLLQRSERNTPQDYLQVMQDQIGQSKEQLLYRSANGCALQGPMRPTKEQLMQMSANGVPSQGLMGSSKEQLIYMSGNEGRSQGQMGPTKEQLMHMYANRGSSYDQQKMMNVNGGGIIFQEQMRAMKASGGPSLEQLGAFYANGGPSQKLSQVMHSNESLAQGSYANRGLLPEQMRAMNGNRGPSCDQLMYDQLATQEQQRYASGGPSAEQLKFMYANKKQSHEQQQFTEASRTSFQEQQKISSGLSLEQQKAMMMNHTKTDSNVEPMCKTDANEPLTDPKLELRRRLLSKNHEKDQSRKTKGNVETSVPVSVSLNPTPSQINNCAPNTPRVMHSPAYSMPTHPPSASFTNQTPLLNRTNVSSNFSLYHLPLPINGRMNSSSAGYNNIVSTTPAAQFSAYPQTSQERLGSTKGGPVSGPYSYQPSPRSTDYIPTNPHPNGKQFLPTKDFRTYTGGMQDADYKQFPTMRGSTEPTMHQADKQNFRTVLPGGPTPNSRRAYINPYDFPGRRI